VNANNGNRTAVVTGANAGIGSACSQLLRDDGWQVVGWDIAPEADEDFIRPVDVSDYETVERAAAGLEDVELLVNCAGISDRAPAADMQPNQWQRVIDVDLTGTFNCCQALHRALSARGGVIVNIASIAGHRSFPCRANYCAAKAGVVALTEVLGLEWASDGIRVVAVSPGFVRTGMMDVGIELGYLTEKDMTGRTPQGRLASPDELARAIVALASDAFSFMTGTTVIVDGGWCANGGF